MLIVKHKFWSDAAILKIGALTMTILSLFAQACRSKTGPVSQTGPVKWEHGWKTDRVIATRYENKNMGFNIGFKFPKDPNNCDRIEIGDFMEANDGWIYQGGGSPGAEAFVKFTDVKDSASADKKLVAILPALDKLMSDISNGVKTPPLPKKKRAIVDAQGKEWPECVPSMYGGSSDGYRQYKCSAGGRVVVDEEAMKAVAQYEQHRRDLVWALRSRVLTDGEMKEVEQAGSQLLTQQMVSYRQEEVDRQFNDLILQQFRLRIAANKAADK